MVWFDEVTSYAISESEDETDCVSARIFLRTVRLQWFCCTSNKMLLYWRAESGQHSEPPENIGLAKPNA